MKLQRNEDVILEIFGCFGGIVLERIDFDDCDNYTDKGEAVADALDCELVYYNQQWEIMRHYQNPENANLQEAIGMFF